ncbi:MAG: hypothetical protein AMXMBFR37_01920 [Steroidobacteraceae bacterium]
MTSLQAPRSLHLAAIVLAALSLGGCALLDGGCYVGCGEERASSTPLVSFLYPNGQVPAPAEAPVLPVPMRVGLAFVPGDYGDLPAGSRYAVLERVRARFADLPYVESITIIPDGYLHARSGFTGLQQVARLQGFDAMALVSLDSVANLSENKASFLYLTIIGAYLVKGSEHETHTLLDLAVVEPHSATLLFRAAGTSALADDSTAVDQSKAIYRQRERGLELASEQLLGNLAAELDSFAARVKNGTAPIKVAQRDGGGGGGGGGAIDGLTAMWLLALALMRPGVRAFRGTGYRASAPA